MPVENKVVATEAPESPVTGNLVFGRRGQPITSVNKARCAVELSDLIGGLRDPQVVVPQFDEEPLLTEREQELRAENASRIGLRAGCDEVEFRSEKRRADLVRREGRAHMTLEHVEHCATVDGLRVERNPVREELFGAGPRTGHRHAANDFARCLRGI